MIPDEDAPFKLRVLRSLTDVIKSVTPVNGYVSDLADFDPGDGTDMPRVFRGRPWFGDNDPIPMVSILEGTTPADDLFDEPADCESGEYDWQILVQGWVHDDPVNPTDPAYVLMRDVRRRLIREKTRKKPNSHIPDPFGSSTFGFPGCAVTKLRVGSGVVRPADDVSAKAWFWLSLTIRIVETEPA